MCIRDRVASIECDFKILFSDGTLNPSGVRFGSAEIYNIGISLSLSLTHSLTLTDSLTYLMHVHCIYHIHSHTLSLLSSFQLRVSVKCLTACVLARNLREEMKGSSSSSRWPMVKSSLKILLKESKHSLGVSYQPGMSQLSSYRPQIFL